MATPSGKNVLVIGGAVPASAMRPRPARSPTRAAMPAEARKSMLENVARALPVKRVGQAEDCADQILLMLRNTFMTGSVVYVDGGGLLI